MDRKDSLDTASGSADSPAGSVPRRMPGSPFVVGRPLRADEPIFGRSEALRFLGSELGRFSSVNLIGERRMGKTSVLNHLLGRWEHSSPPKEGTSALVVRLDLQRDIPTADRFYGETLRGLQRAGSALERGKARTLAAMTRRLGNPPEADIGEFESALRQIREASMLPIVVVDEFERLLEPGMAEGYPYPSFFNGLRALMTADLIAMAVASRRPLAEYFSDPARPGGMTSSWPTYFQPFTLSELDDRASEALLLQKSDHPLKGPDVLMARKWAGGHPCHLQAAGQAWYLAKTTSRGWRWARSRFKELKAQNCLVCTGARPRTMGWATPLRVFKALFFSFPVALGRTVQRLGIQLDTVAAWLLGFVLIMVLLLLVFGPLPWSDLLKWLQRYLGFEGPSRGGGA